MARHGKVVSPWDKQRRWTAPFRWTAFPLIAVARPFFQWLAGTRAFIAVGPKIVPKLDRCVHRLSGGRLMMSRTLIPTLLLITTGHRTGHQRRAPMTCLPEADGSFLVVGSNWGRETHPHWSISLLRRPQAVVSYKGYEIPVAARLLEGAERDRAWPRLLDVWPVYDRYTLKSGRRLRVFRLEPQRPLPARRHPLPQEHPLPHGHAPGPYPPPPAYPPPVPYPRPTSQPSPYPQQNPYPRPGGGLRTPGSIRRPGPALAR
jgi:deazaflavin-dependent oxidoreductase (nitroreductase family)